MLGLNPIVGDRELCTFRWAGSAGQAGRLSTYRFYSQVLQLQSFRTFPRNGGVRREIPAFCPVPPVGPAKTKQPPSSDFLSWNLVTAKSCTKPLGKTF